MARGGGSFQKVSTRLLQQLFTGRRNFPLELPDTKSNIWTREQSKRFRQHKRELSHHIYMPAEPKFIVIL
jgi:hypothetical protein